jgi:hypothetical protein
VHRAVSGLAPVLLGLALLGHLDQLTSFGVDDGRELWATTLTGGLYEVRAA